MLWARASSDVNKEVKEVSNLQLLEVGTYKTVKTRFWPWLSGKSLENIFSCSLFAR